MKIMLWRRTTSEIISSFKESIEKYDESCRHIFDYPSKEALERKVKLIMLLGGLQDRKPVIAMLIVYKFYLEYRYCDSRLIQNMREAFLELLSIPNSKVQHSSSRSATNCQGCEIQSKRNNLFYKKMSTMKKNPAVIDEYEIQRTLKYIVIGAKNKDSFLNRLPQELWKIIAASVAVSINSSDAFSIVDDHLERLRRRK